MGIFTALFSLITVNIDFFKNVCLNANSNIILAFILVNVTVITAIAVMMWIIKHFLFNNSDK